MTRNPTASERRPWKLDAGCRDVDPETWYDAGQVQAAKKVCAGCPVRARCLEFALDTAEPWGVWGGFDADERRRLQAGQPAHVCERCGTTFVPARHNRRCCTDCVKPEPILAVAGMEKHRDVIAALTADGWTDRQIGARMGYSKAQIRYWRKQWGIRSTRPHGGRPDSDLAPCGTPAAIRRHQRRGEPVDETCRRADARRAEDRRAKQAVAA